LVLAADVLTYRDGTTGVNAAETELTPPNVNTSSFGKLFAVSANGQVYAQPLVATGVTIAAGPNTNTGAAGLHDVVFVATEHDILYAIDANAGGTGAILWSRSFLNVAGTPGQPDVNNTLNATAITTVPSNDVGTSDISPEIGITGTPVIDPAKSTLYVVVTTKEIVGGTPHYVQRLHAINVSNGTDRATPYLIGDTTGGNTNNTQIYAYGTGDGAVTDPYNGTGKQVVQFNALTENERGALSLVNNTVYVDWASHGDNGPFHGWIAKWDVSNLASTGLRLSGVFCTSPNDGEAGIWQGGGALAFEANGSAFYVETGNGTGGEPTLDANGFPTNANYNEAALKVMADPSSGPKHQNPNGWGMKAADYFIPYNVMDLDGADSDFGAGAPLLLPDSAGIPGHPHLMLASGKEGKIYVLDRDNLGKFNPSNDSALNAVPDGSGNNTPPVQLGGSLSTAAYYNGSIYWISGYGSYTYAYALNANGTLSVKSQTAISTFGFLAGSVVVSSNGANDGIVWVMDTNLNQIHAYDASTLATELWNSGQAAGGGDNLGAVVKFAVPTVANGEVFVGTSNSLVVYGLKQPPTAVPIAPTLSATGLSSSAVNLTWTDTSLMPNTATGYSIEDSTDGTNFTAVTTSPAGSTSIAVGGLQPRTTYFFRIRGFNGLGDSPYSNVASAATTNQGAPLDFSGGFAGAASKLTLNGSSTLNGSKLQLTDGGTGEAASAFSTNALDVAGFSTQFTFQLTAGYDTADGFTFTIQRDANTALGSYGGGLGYASIGNSVAVKFDLADNAGEGADSTGLYTGGAAPTNVGSIDMTPSGVDLHSGDVFQVDMAYDGATLFVTIKDTQSGQAVSESYPINIPATVGGNTAFVGFTAGTGGVTSTQDILTWTYSPSATSSPNAPSGLGASPASATSVNLTWTNNAANQAGFHLDRATNAEFTQNLITETLPASLNSFTDTATGLAPGSTFYYRLRSFNAAGDSGGSNVARVTIPVAPPRPTNQQVINVTSTEIDLSWQDNAGHKANGYHILRAANHGGFIQVASLPLTSRTPPSTYKWADTHLTPGTFYEYHIIAYNTSGNNDFAGLNATTITTPPGALTATAGVGVVDLWWTAPAGAVSYDIYRGTSRGHEGATPIAKGVTATTYTDTGFGGVTYYYTVVARNANGAFLPSRSRASNEAGARVLFGAHINFSNSTKQVPPGHINDVGQAYGSRVKNLSFGWNTNRTGYTRNRNSKRSPDESHDSFILMQNPNGSSGNWSIAVPNGKYSVHVLAGDPDRINSVFAINVQGVPVVRGTPTAANHWFEGTVTVTVRNGRLTVTSGRGAKNNKIDAIDITQIAN
jgi:hypothetical protein